MFNIEPGINYEIILDFLKSKEIEELLWVYESPVEQQSF